MHERSLFIDALSAPTFRGTREAVVICYLPVSTI